MSRRGGAAAWGIAIAILLLLAGWNTSSGAGTVRFTQPYEPSVWRVWESRKLARRPSDVFWAGAGRVLHVRWEARVDRGAAELTVRGLLVGPAAPLVERTLTSSGAGEARVSIPESGFYRLAMTSDLGAFGGQVQARWTLE